MFLIMIAVIAAIATGVVLFLCSEEYADNASSRELRLKKADTKRKF